MRAFLIAAMCGVWLAPAGHAETQSELSQLETYCLPDMERLCPGVPVGEGKVKACLEKHREEISVGCAEALKRLKTK